MKQNDPYAGLGTYEQGGADPYAGLGVVEKAMPRTKAPRTGMDKATQVAGVAANALLPYATAAGMGAMAGAPFAGVGAPFGAAGGVLALGLGDLGTSAYNLAAPLFGGQRVSLPSEAMQQGYQSIGATRAPETPGEQVFSDVLSGAVGGAGQAKAFQTLASKATSPQARNFMRAMGQNIRGQAAAGAGAAGAPSVASNFLDVTNPAALLGLGLAGGGAGFKAGTPKPKLVTAGEIVKESSDLYKQMKAANVNIAPQAMTDLATQVRAGVQNLPYDPDTDEVVNQALKMLDVKSGKPISFDMLEKFRRKIRDLPYNKSGTSSVDSDERSVITVIDDLIDDFMDGLTPAQTTSGDPAAAAALIKQARTTRATGYKTETIENAFKKASDASSPLDATKSFPQALRDEFRNIYKNKRTFAKFDKPTQDLIEKVVKGTATQKTLVMLGKLSPSARKFADQLPIYGAGYGGLATLSPEGAVALGGLQAAGAVAKGVSNQMTRRQANRALVSAAQPGGVIKPGGPGFYVLSPVAQQNVMAQERAQRNQR
jgi:hypothetical protein